MSLYAKYVLPQLIDLAMRNKEATRLRAKCVPQARGEVLEIGMGSGLNLPFYSPEVHHVYGVDPSAGLLEKAAKKISSVPFEITFLGQSAEKPLPLEHSSIDTVVTTWTLCSIADPIAALQEAKRVLKASGRIIFIEHGRSPDSKITAWQDWLTPVWKRIGGGCHLNRKIDDIIRAAGFKIYEQKTFYLTGLRPMTYTYQGVARAV
jgi:ubiquinone/menaquinone biosynthesis C-methylase UbiE